MESKYEYWMNLLCETSEREKSGFNSILSLFSIRQKRQKSSSRRIVIMAEPGQLLYPIQFPILRGRKERKFPCWLTPVSYKALEKIVAQTYSCLNRYISLDSNRALRPALFYRYPRRS